MQQKGQIMVEQFAQHVVRRGVYSCSKSPQGVKERKCYAHSGLHEE